MFRRRPLARAAVVGGTAYYAGKKGAQSAAARSRPERRIDDLQAQQYQAAAPAPAAPAKDPMEQLKELAALHEQGVLTDAEFEIQKTKILQSM